MTFPHVDTVTTARSPEHERALTQVGRRAWLVAPRAAVLALVCLLSLTTGAALLLISSTLMSSTLAVPASGRAVDRRAPAAPPSVDALATVHAFYAGSNGVLRTGDPASLEALLAPGLLEHADRPGLPSGRDGLMRYLTMLREAHPTLRFEVEEVLASGEFVSVRVTARAPDSADLPDGSSAQTVSWHGVDVFRVRDGLVAERWTGSDAPSLVQSLARMTLDHWPKGTSMMAAARLTFARHAEVREVALPGPGLVVVEGGTLAVRGAGEEQVLGAGEVGAFPSGTGALSLRNAGTDQMVALAVAWLPATGVQGAQADSPVGQPGRPNPTVLVLGGGLALAMLPLGDGGRTIAYSGVTVTPLASLGPIGAAQVPPGRVMVTVDRVMLASRVSLPPHPAQGPVLLTVEAGNLVLVPARETAQIRPGPGNETIVSTGGEAALTTGVTAVWDAGAVALLRGGHDTAGSAVLLTISPAGQGGENVGG